MGERLTNHGKTQFRGRAAFEVARIAYALRKGDKRDLVADSKLVASLTREEVSPLRD